MKRCRTDGVALDVEAGIEAADDKTEAIGIVLFEQLCQICRNCKDLPQRIQGRKKV